MPEFSEDTLFGRDPHRGMLVADCGDVAVLLGERVHWLEQFHGLKTKFQVPAHAAFGTLIKNYRVKHVQVEPGKAVITLTGDTRYATVDDFRRMLRIPTGVGTEQLLKALHREMEERDV
jgi:hypothetical protein